MHVFFLGNSAWNIWHFRRPIIASILERGHQVTVAAPHDETVPHLRDLGCDVIIINIDSVSLNPISGVILTLKLRNIFSRIRPTIVLGFTIKCNIFGALAARSAQVSFIPNVSGLGTAFISSIFLRFLAQILYKVALNGLPVVFFQNLDDAYLFERRKIVRQHQVRLLPGSGVDLDHFRPVNLPQSNSIVFLMVARILRQKGVIEFIEAAKRVRALYPNCRFQLLGPADTQNRTAFDIETVKSWERSHGIEYLGVSTDVRTQISAAHCVVLPSYREGAPRTLIEAAAMARPLIATDVPGCRAVVEADRNGFMCHPQDSSSLAAACLRFLALSPDQQRSMGLLGRAKMEKEFDQAVVVKQYLEAMEYTLPTRHPG